jgi:DNA polymerase-3 subunit gamma/tau
MSYKVLSRKWRPKSFQDLKGQESTRTTLVNAIKNKRLHHALLFSGPRGTGKTSTARIISKILRCTNLSENFEPCNTCKDCVEISQSRNLDVLEIDGASNNGVDSIRELRDQVNFNPTSGANKIYIIDEVHMLSTSAFNALLKTLEEPPDNVYFMMATTEPHKIPKTILSRCQRFDFRPVPLNEVLGLLKEICKDEGVEFEEEALFLIAQTGGGCVRDSLSFLDQAITFANGKLTFDEVSKNIGVTDIASYKTLIEALIAREGDAVVEELLALREKQTEPQVFLEELVVYIKNLILFKVDLEQVKSLQDFSETQKIIYEELSKKAQLEDLYILFDICFKGTLDMSRAFSPQSILEVTLLKAGTAPFYNDLKGVSETTSSSTLKKTKVVAAESAQGSEQKKKSIPDSSASVESKEEKSETTNKSLGGWVGFVKKVNTLNPIVGAKLESCSYSYDASSKKLYIKAGDKIKFMESELKSDEFLKKVQNYLNSLWQEGIEVAYAADEADEEAPQSPHTLEQSSEQPNDTEDPKPKIELKKSVIEQESEDKSERLAKLRQEVENLSVIKSLTQERGGKIVGIEELKD